MNVWQTGVAVYNCETDTSYERIIPRECISAVGKNY